MRGDRVPRSGCDAAESYPGGVHQHDRGDAAVGETPEGHVPAGRVATVRDGEQVGVAGWHQHDLPAGRFRGGEGELALCPFQADRPAAQVVTGIDAQERLVVLRHGCGELGWWLVMVDPLA